MNFGGYEMTRTLIEFFVIASIVFMIIAVIVYSKSSDSTKREIEKGLVMIMWATLVIGLFSVVSAVFLGNSTLLKVLLNGNFLRLGR